MRQLMAAGVPILAGTDAAKLGTTHGAGMHRELEMLLDSGLTHKQALSRRLHLFLRRSSASMTAAGSLLNCGPIW